ncbi:MAG: hypothetical protein KDK34_10325 [Leptospiraceae bacterium]|nr:hypothetical protein [Leptospiraceae bacterium]
MVFHSKKSLRAHCRETWTGFLRQPGSVNRILEQLDALIRSRIQTHSRVLITLPMPDELDYLRILSMLSNELYAPRTLPQGMEFRRWQLHEAPIAGHFNVPGPVDDAPPLHWPLRSDDIVIVPTMGTDPKGYRLGRGGGYYDRMREQLQSGFLIAPVPEALSRLPFQPESHDTRVNAIVTEAGFRFT